MSSTNFSQRAFAAGSDDADEDRDVGVIDGREAGSTLSIGAKFVHQLGLGFRLLVVDAVGSGAFNLFPPDGKASAVGFNNPATSVSIAVDLSANNSGSSGRNAALVHGNNADTNARLLDGVNNNAGLVTRNNNYLIVVIAAAFAGRGAVSILNQFPGRLDLRRRGLAGVADENLVVVNIAGRALPSYSQLEQFSAGSSDVAWGQAYFSLASMAWLFLFLTAATLLVRVLLLVVVFFLTLSARIRAGSNKPQDQEQHNNDDNNRDNGGIVRHFFYSFCFQLFILSYAYNSSFSYNIIITV